MVEPITPQQAKEKKAELIPEFVVAAFNSLLVKSINELGKATIKQDDVLDAILTWSGNEGGAAEWRRECAEVSNNTSRNRIFERDWLDVEPIFRKAGWTVMYVKGEYYETSPIYFEFIWTKKGKSK